MACGTNEILMKKALTIGFILAVAASAAHADTLRCGSKLIMEGDPAGKVLERCGEPQNKQVITEPVRAATALGGTNVVGTYTYEIWRYTRGAGKFPALLRIEGGVVKKLEFER
jgi:hypothetical protein